MICTTEASAGIQTSGTCAQGGGGGGGADPARETTWEIVSATTWGTALLQKFPVLDDNIFPAVKR